MIFKCLKPCIQGVICLRKGNNWNQETSYLSSLSSLRTANEARMGRKPFSAANYSGAVNFSQSCTHWTTHTSLYMRRQQISFTSSLLAVNPRILSQVSSFNPSISLRYLLGSSRFSSFHQYSSDFETTYTRFILNLQDHKDLWAVNSRTSSALGPRIPFCGRKLKTATWFRF